MEVHATRVTRCNYGIFLHELSQQHQKKLAERDATLFHRVLLGIIAMSGAKVGPASSSQKRKDGPTKGGNHNNNKRNNNQNNNNQRAAKRAKIHDARTIRTQPSDAAFRDGELDLSAFLRSREFEIHALEMSMRRSAAARSTRAFQLVPRALRRRTASHNVKRVPKRLRARARHEHAADQTPTVEARRRKPRTTRARIRAETAKRLGILAEKKRKKKVREEKRKAKAKEKEKGKEKDPTAASSGKGGQSGGDGAVSSVPSSTKPTVHTRPARPKIRCDRLNEPPKPKAKFRKRQVNKTWLPTHLWHAKRAKMTDPKEPLWRFAVPLTPNEKCYRSTHRATGQKGVVVWDTSYMSTIGLYGFAEGIERVLRALGLTQQTIWGNRGQKWRTGSRTWNGNLSRARRKEDGSGDEDEDEDLDVDKKLRRLIGPATIIWNPESTSSEPSGEAVGAKKQQRQILIRTHPACFLELFNELLRLAKQQTPRLYIEDLRFEIGSIELAGPASTEALLGVLHPYFANKGVKGPEERQAAIFRSLIGVTNPLSLPRDALLAFSVTDPRLRYPPKQVVNDSMRSMSESQQYSFLQDTLAQWPADENPQPHVLFDRDARFRASRLPSQKAISRRKSLAPPGEELGITDSDPPVPVIITTMRSGTGDEGSTAQGTWTLMAPWACILPIWYSLVHYPLTSGGNPSFGGLDEARQVAFERGVPWFPGDFPGTDAGAAWELEQRARRKREWERRPKGRRVEWTSLDLGAGRKGEVGDGLACDFERLLGLPGPGQQQQPAGESSTRRAEDVMDVDAAEGAEVKDIEMAEDTEDKKTTTPDYSSSSLGMINLMDKSSFNALLAKEKSHTDDDDDLPPHALITVSLTFVTRGMAKPCARIYRLPPPQNSAPAAAADPPRSSVQVPATPLPRASLPANLRDQWLAQLPLKQQQQLPGRKTASARPSNKPTRAAQHNQQRPPPPPPPPLPPPPHTSMTSASQRLLAELEADKQHMALALLHKSSNGKGYSSSGEERPWPPRARTATVSNEADIGGGAHPLCPDEEDLIGFVTTGAFSLSEGGGAAVGSISAAKALEAPRVTTATKAGGDGGGARREGRLCVVRNAGENVGWLARWELV